MPFVTPVSRESLSRGRNRQSIPALKARAQELELLQRETGAPAIEQDSPGVFSRIVDVLSRPNYAIAGFAEELLDGTPSVTQGVTRAMAEIFSGVGGIQGEKRAFGEVMENLGVGTKTLADAFPVLEGTWVGHFGSRGAAGLALDIATDPLTYMTFGASTGLRITSSKGVRYLNKAGKAEWNKIYKGALDEVKGELDDAIAKKSATKQNTILERVEQATEDAFEAAFTKGDDIAPELLEKGGAKVFGAKIPGTDKLGVPLRRALDMLPESVSKPAIEGATKMKAGMREALNGVFGPNGALDKLPEPMRSRAIRITDIFFESSVAHRGHLLGQADDLGRQFNKMFKKGESRQAANERWYDIREGELGRDAFTSADEAQLFDETMALYDSMGKTALEAGVLRPEQYIKGSYISHRYLNAEDLNQYQPRPGVKIDPGNKAKYQKQRVYESYREAQRESRKLHAQALRSMSKGEADKMYPILDPDFDVFGNLQAYIGGHSDALARKAWSEELIARFGKNVNDIIPDFDQLYDDAIKRNPRGAGPDWFNPESIPLRRAIDELDIEPALVAAFGKEGAQYIAVKGAQTGNELVYLPREIAKSLESVNSSLFNTKDYREFGKFLKGYDWFNNNFKWGVYINPIWIASRVRNAYSNMAQSALRIGVAAIDPRRHVDAISLMAGRDLGKEFASSGFTIGQLRQLFKSSGIIQPGQVYVEQAGRLKLGRTRRAITEATAQVENEARVLLGLEEIRRGATIKQATDTVNEFLFNYGRMSGVEKTLFRRIFPFYTFTRKNVELQWKALRRNPGRVINEVKPFRKRDSENEMMMKWEREGLGIRLNKDGKTIHALQGVDLPIRNLDTIWAGGLGSTGRRIMGMVSPLIKTPLEAITGRDFFTGGDMKRSFAPTLGWVLDSKHTPKGLKDWLGFKKEVDEAGRTSYTFDGVRYAMVAKSWMFSRALSSSDRVFFREYADTDLAAPMLDFLIGIRYKEIDLDDQQRRVLRRRIKELENSLVRRGKMETFTRGFQPNESRQRRTSL